MLAGARDRADFVRNAMADPKVTVRISGQAGPATARIIDPRSDEDALARRLVLAKYQAPGERDLDGWARSALPVAFDLDF